jgi:hypothetical protein
MKPLFYMFLICLGASVGAPAFAEKDVILNAVNDEMKRTSGELHTASHPKPYFISYTVRDVDEAVLGSCLGSEAEINRARWRVLDPMVRIGDYKLDSSYPLTTHPHYLRRLTTDDDYPALRHGIWLETDKEYKNAVTNFECRRSFG